MDYCHEIISIQEEASLWLVSRLCRQGYISKPIFLISKQSVDDHFFATHFYQKFFDDNASDLSLLFFVHVSGK